LTFQVQRTVSASHLSAGRFWGLMPKRTAMRCFAGVGAGLDGFLVEFGIEHQRDVEHAFIAAAQQGQGAVRGHAGDGFGKVEPVAELGAFGFLAFNDG
jgi:hypothetical protein